MDQSLAEGKPMDLPGFKTRIKTFEQNWVDEPKDGFATVETGDPVKMANHLFEKYQVDLLSE